MSQALGPLLPMMRSATADDSSTSQANLAHGAWDTVAPDIMSDSTSPTSGRDTYDVHDIHGTATAEVSHVVDSESYGMIYEYDALARQHMKVLLLTAPGERMFDPEFGVGLRNYLFEQNHHTTYDQIDSKIRSQVSNYLPYIKIKGINFSTTPVLAGDDHILNIGVEYYVVPLKLSDRLSIEFRNAETISNITTFNDYNVFR